MALDPLATDFTRLNVGTPVAADTTDGSLTAAGNIKAEGNLTYGGALAGPTDTATGGNPSPGSSLLLYKAIPLTAAQIIAMFTTPVPLIAAPGAGKAIVVHGAMLRMTRTSTAFTGGGVAVVQYHTGTVAATGTIAASVITGSAGVADFRPVAVAAATVENDVIELTNATAVFAAGTGTGVLHIWYSIV